jgi:tripartite ATP-independent transporter DctM subunit
MESLGAIIGIYLACLLALIFSGTPIAFALGLMAVGSVWLGFGSSLMPALGMLTWDALASFVLVAIPLFIFMGFILFESGLSTRIYAGIYPLLDRLIPGGLLHSNVVVGAVFAACSGSSVASTATIGSVALPEMESRGYDVKIAAGSVAAGGTLGVLIPPSIVMIIYGAMTRTSVSKLFIGGLAPGVILAAAYMFYIYLRVRFQPQLVQTGGKVEKLPWKDCILEVLRVWPTLILIIGVLGSIYLGIGTPSEAAAIGCALAIVLTVCYGRLSLDVLKRSFQGAVRTTSMLLFIYLGATLMGIYLSNSGLTMSIAVWVTGLALPPLATFCGIGVMYLILGMIMDGLAAIVITLPITFPIITKLGFDPVWFGVVLTMFGECALLTPPVGMNLFILQGLRPDYPFTHIIRGSVPFFLVLIAVIIIMISFPQIILFLPKTMVG